MLNIVDPTICAWKVANFLIFSENLEGSFQYYGHFLPSLSGLIIAIFVLRTNWRNKAAQALLFTTTMFAIWCFLDLITWASPRSDIIMFVWSTLMYFELLMYVGAFYFIYAFYNQKFPSFKIELAIFTMFLPLILFGHTTLNLIGFDYTNCLRYASEGPLWQYYVYGFEFLFVGLILLLTIKELYRKKHNQRETILVSTGILLFLLSFSIGNIIGSFLGDWKSGQIGLFGMPIFVAFLGYILVRYETFKVKLLATEALMAGQLILLVSLLFVRSIENAQIIAVATILFFSILGTLLIKSVRSEVSQREEIEMLASNLESTNERLRVVDKQKSEFVSIASHQLRSPLTAIRGYTSMILDGNYGKAPDEMIEVLGRIHESAKLMAFSIEDFLNVSRIESGNMKYTYSEFNLCEQAEHIVDDLRPEATRSGLLLLFKSNIASKGIVRADISKTQQILHNLINNSLKYTQKGTITVYVHENHIARKLYVEVIDTGIGMDQETVKNLFQKFSRAKNANSVNINGTGLGLFVAREMARTMGGDITCKSDGDGKGSSFVLSLPLIS
ncbi:MAG: ATP-binding protein [Patescibacteria group bacterium]